MFLIQCTMLINSLILLCQIYRYSDTNSKISVPTNINTIV